MKEILIFVAAFTAIGLGCFQTVNVANGRRWLTAATSLIQGTAALTLYRYAPHVSTFGAAAAFLLGGVCGGQLSLLVTHTRDPAREPRTSKRALP